MDMLGDLFDGLNGAATTSLLRFDHPNRQQSIVYDDRVTVGYFDLMWEAMGCSPNMATAGRAQPNVESTMALMILIAQEVTAGVLVGAMARVIMSALQVAGYLIATQTGLAYAQTIDPTQNTQGAVLGNFMTLLGVTLIFLTNLHHLAIGAIAGSYRMLPPGGHLPTGDMAQLVIQLTSSSFALGFQLAAPFLVFGFALYAGLGVLARLMPQLQIFFVAVPLNIMCGFLILLALIGSLMTVFLTYYTNSMATFL
jgi:flagellar biosynthetic protein FliR